MREGMKEGRERRKELCVKHFSSSSSSSNDDDDDDDNNNNNNNNNNNIYSPSIRSLQMWNQSHST